MSDVYENCPAFENDKFLLRFSQLDDAEDLVSVYSDKNALPFFNSDNCHGDNFYYPNEDRMRQAIKFWLSSYSSKWFVRWTIIDKEKHEAIGTIEVFHRSANNNFNHVGVLRLDLKSEYETSEEIFTIMNLIVPPTFDLFECEEIITKVPVYAVERIEAMKRVGFKKSTKLLVGTMDGYAYKDYWTINRGVYIPLDDLEAKEKA
jgi:ribosomal-protein-alanine N-acetyltransferase